MSAIAADIFIYHLQAKTAVLLSCEMLAQGYPPRKTAHKQLLPSHEGQHSWNT